MDRLRYAGQASAWLIGERIRKLRRSLALVETAIGALRACAKVKRGAARRRSAIGRRRYPSKSTTKPE
ncbi:MAG: hypothetical protein ABSH45_05835 [Bryobacteraceae bacterium]